MSLQKHLDAYARPDKQQNNTRVIVVDPGWTRTPGMRRWLSAGSLWGLLLYLICWPFWWIVLKSPEQGAQSFLKAAMDEKLGRKAAREGPSVERLVKDCREVDFARTELHDEQVGKKLWEASEKRIQELEKEGAIRRAQAKKAEGEEKEMEKDGQAKGVKDDMANGLDARRERITSSRRQTVHK